MDLLSCHVMCVRRDFYSMIMNIESRRSNTKSKKRNGHFNCHVGKIILHPTKDSIRS